jgi:hypothetical protein
VLNKQLKHVEEAFVFEVDLISYLKKLFAYSKQKNAYFFICRNDGKWEQRSYRVQEINKAIQDIFASPMENIYCSASVHSNRQRVEESVSQIPALILDLDYYKTKYKDYDFEKILEILEKKYFNNDKIPRPNAVTNSGGGMYLIWCFKYQPANPGVLKKRKVVMKILFEMLKEFGADAKSLDAPHVFRIPYTYNTKNGERKLVRTYFNELPNYTLADFARRLPSLWDVWKKEKKIKIEKDKKPKNKSAKIYSLDPEKTLAYDYIQTAQKLIEIRNGDCEGYREMFLFFIRNYYHWMHKDRFYAGDETLFEESLNLAYEINKKFKKPLSDEEIESQTLNKSKLYRFKVETFYDWFDVEMEERLQLKLKTKEVKKEKSKLQMRKLRGSVSREEYLAKVSVKDKGIELKEKGYKYKEIAEELGVSIDTVKGWFRKKK